MENMKTFNHNGFHFVMDDSAQGCKLKLSAIPYSKDKEFGVPGRPLPPSTPTPKDSFKETRCARVDSTIG